MSSQPTDADVEGTRRILAEIDRRVQLAKAGSERIVFDVRQLAGYIAEAHADERQRHAWDRAMAYGLRKNLDRTVKGINKLARLLIAARHPRG